MVRILHAGDFHLDSAFGALTPEQARQRRAESRRMPERMVDWANDHGVQLLLLAGDLFDGDDLSGDTAKLLARALGGFQGQVVIAHGTDTMAYTAAALSYLVQGSPKPIVLTGAQKPIWFDGTDSKRNLTDAFLYACRGCGGVQIVFNGKVILGTRARKTCSKSYHAFSSVNYPDLAVVQDGRLLQYMRCTCYPRPVFYNTLDDRVSLLKLIPGTSSQLIDFMLDRSDGLIIESFGVGGLPEYHGSEFYDAVRRGVERGKIVVMTTQVPNEGSDLTVYHVGGRLKSTLRLLEAYDMTTESAVAKLMWILGQTRDFDEAERLFYRPVARDILCENES